MVLPGMRSSSRRLLGGVWNSAFRVKSPRYHVTSEQEGSVINNNLWELANVAFSGSILIGCLVVAGQVGAYLTGPGGAISAVIATISVSLTGICYAEFRSRWPRVCGSLYEYTYLSIGEGVAFVVFLMTLIQDIAMVAAAGRAFSQNLDFLLGNAIENRTRQVVGCWDAVGCCPNPLGGATVLAVSALISCGVRGKEQLLTLLSNCVVAIVLVFMLVLGLFHLDFSHWSKPTDFFPTSYPGVMEGAATIIYAFSTFEPICSRSDFSRQKSGHTAVMAFTLSGFVSCGLFTAVVATTTLLVPIGNLHTETPVAEAFSYAGVTWTKFVVCVPTMLTLLFYMRTTLTRVHDLLEAVSLDALLCARFSDVSDRTRVALASVTAPAVISAVLSVVFSLTNLLQLASLSCLVVAIITCTAAVCIRFRPSILVHSPTHTTHKDRQARRKLRKRQQGKVDTVPVRNGGYGSVTKNNNTDDCPMLLINSDDEEEHFLGTASYDIDGNTQFELLQRKLNGISSDSDTDIDDAVEEYKEELRIAALTSCSFLTPKSETPTNVSARRAAWTVTLFVACLFGLFLIITQGGQLVREGNVVLIILLIIVLLLIIALLAILIQHPQDPVSDLDLQLSFPLSPWIPLLAIILDVHLSLNLAGLAWIQASVVFIIGCLFYCIYSMRNSQASHFYQFLPEEETILLPEPSHTVVEPQELTSIASEPRPTTSSEEDVPLVD